MYLLEKVVSRVEGALAGGVKTVSSALAAAADADGSEPWVDIGGQMMPRGRLNDLCQAVEEGRISDLDGLNAELDRIHAAYAEDEWAWVRQAYAREFGRDLDHATPDDLAQAAEQLLDTRGKFLKMVLHDATKEFDAGIRTGFAQDGSDEDVPADFAAVRGTLETNKFVTGLEREISSLAERVERFKAALSQVAAGNG